MLAQPWRKMLATSKTGASFATLACSATRPSGDGYYDFGAGTSTIGKTTARSVCELHCQFYGAGADNTAFDARVVGFCPTDGNTDTVIWVPTVLVNLTCTRSAFVGLGSRNVASTDRFADTIVVHATFGQPRFTDTDSAGAASSGSIKIYSPANDIPGYVIIPIHAPMILYFDFATTGGTNSNGLFKFVG